jgi:zinc finger protein 143/76
MRSHTGDRPFKCDFDGCNKSFTTSYSHKSHIRTHTNERPYICSMDACNKGFKTSGDLQKHRRTHTGLKLMLLLYLLTNSLFILLGHRPFSCTVQGCNKAFTTSNILKTHLRVHTGERPYECPHLNCGKTFSSSTNYRNHVRIHSGEKPFECKYKVNIKFHYYQIYAVFYIKSIFRFFYKFKCIYCLSTNNLYFCQQNCGKRFTEYSSLYKHKSVHTITKSFSCCICLKTFRQESSLTLHRRNVHGMEFPEKVNVLDVRIDENEQLNASKIISISTEEKDLLLDKNYQSISITLDSQQIILLSNAVE